ncbi:MAG: glucosamine-6-phosphate isomerase [Candidatus Delongbacteria bacterium]|nr:glucosamine-6-phosphate isomerase [Candidatus Delongbacteria bacterium]MBN2834751.1 glucosamine-6-phosphate isomerase [Candidatus Delongbacteria bacterium]
MQRYISEVESKFSNKSKFTNLAGKISYICVESFPSLGLLTALRFIEWANENPKGVVSLPTGKTPEFFIKYTNYIKKFWDLEKVQNLRDQYLKNVKKFPKFDNMRFVQIDEFYPISSRRTNSFNYYVNKYYIDGFGFNKENSLLIDCNKIKLYNNMHFEEVFRSNIVDLSLRNRTALNFQEEIAQKSIFLIDDWCTEYECKVRDLGGIGFFLGGIGPDGHIAFNVRGADRLSTTRLTETNFETQAASASDLGGIEISSKKLVITIGLGTICYNANVNAIIFAAGDAKAEVVKNAVESEISNVYPATVLQKLQNSRLYLTESASLRLSKSQEFLNQQYDFETGIIKNTLEQCQLKQKYLKKLINSELLENKFLSKTGKSYDEITRYVEEAIINRLNKGLVKLENCRFFHTGPHHDDIMLGLMPYINRLIKEPSNKHKFAVLTSGFTAVTNDFLLSFLKDLLIFVKDGQIQMLSYSDFFDSGYKLKWDKDVYHYLTKVASGDENERRRGVCHRLTRAIVDVYKTENVAEFLSRIMEMIDELENSHPGEKNSQNIQIVKGMLREFEEELVWAHYGVKVCDVKHLRLGFYTGDIFTERPERERDVIPVLNMLREEQPNIITVAFDPEGSGPDTHYKVLQAIAESLRMLSKEIDLSNVRVWGYRNVWYKFQPYEADVIVPVSLDQMAVFDSSFEKCYLSQVNASFPSYEHNGRFSDLAKKIWTNQLKDVQYILGKDYFFMNDHPLLRSAHGLLYFKDMSVEDFLKSARELEKSMEGF